jgi:hypothetical protein
MAPPTFIFDANPGTALWHWDLSPATGPVVKTFFNNLPTKTGLLPADLQMTAGVPLQFYAPAAPQPMELPPETLIGFIRMAEDWVEQETNILLSPTWVASPPEIRESAARIAGVPAADNYSQVLGIDYDLADAAYDFYMDRALDSAWLIQPLRYRPLRNVTTSSADFTALKNVAAIYPLLSEFFTIPPTWYVEDQDAGLIRMVPSVNVQMLPLFAMQLAFMGFSETVPGAWHYQYTAGLTPSDYSARYGFIKRLVLTTASMTALASIQGSINMGLMRVETLVDGLQMKFQYSESGPFGSLIKQFEKERDALMTTAFNMVGGPRFITL